MALEYLIIFSIKDTNTATDPFEATNANWVFNYQEGDGASTLVPDRTRFHSGASSYKSYKNSFRKVLGTTYNKSLRVWYYDDPTNNPSICSVAMVQNTAIATTGRGIGINAQYANSANYCYTLGDYWYNTTIQRTLGWHEMRFDFVTGSDLKMYIDGTLIYTDTSGAVTGFDRITLGDQWSNYNGIVYYDDVTIKDIDDLQ